MLFIASGMSSFSVSFYLKVSLRFLISELFLIKICSFVLFLLAYEYFLRCYFKLLINERFIRFSSLIDILEVSKKLLESLRFDLNEIAGLGDLYTEVHSLSVLAL